MNAFRPYGKPPGSPLDLRIDAGGERWYLEDRPVHAGQGIELALMGERKYCPPCEGEGQTEGGKRCRDCGGSGQWATVLWIGVAFEYVNKSDGTGHALLYPGTWGDGGIVPRHAIEVHSGDNIRCRWRPAG